MQREEDWLVMHALHTTHGWSIARLAREFGVNWRTARRYATARVPRGYRPRPCPAELTEAQLGHVRRRLELCQDLRATTLLREVQELGYAGSYPSFARRVRGLRPESGSVDPPLRLLGVMTAANPMVSSFVAIPKGTRWAAGQRPAPDRGAVRLQDRALAP